MDFNITRLDAVVDFLTFEINTTKPTQAIHVHRAVNGGFSHVEGCSPETGIPFAKGFENTTSTVFRCHVQDPTRFQVVSLIFKSIDDRWGLVASPRLHVMEVALDAYSKGATTKGLAAIAADLYRFSTCTPGDSWYFYRMARDGRAHIEDPKHEDPEDIKKPKGSAEDIPSNMGHNRIVRHFEKQWQLTDRDKDRHEAGARYHLYVKTRNNNADLLPSHYRARFEVTLKGDALPCKTLAELATFSFTKLTTHFKFRQLADDLHPAARYALSLWGVAQLGKPGKYRRRHQTIVGKYRGAKADLIYRRATSADDALNEGAYKRLRELSREWRR